MIMRAVAACGLLSGLLVAPRCPADVLGIDSTTTGPALTNVATPEAAILRFAVGAETYSNLDFFAASAVNNISQPFMAQEGLAPPATVDLPFVLGMLSSEYITQGKANATTVDFDIGGSLSSTDNTLLFMYELNTSGQDGDDVTVYPLNGGGSPIGTWSLTINPADYGPQTPLFNIDFAPVNSLANVGARGVTFTLSDFTGDTGTLTGVEGLRFHDSGAAWDPIAAGAAVPEPGTFTMTALSLLLLAAGFRHRRP